MSEYSRDYSAVQLVPTAFPIRAQVPFGASSVWIVNNTAARMFVSRRSGSPTQNDKDASIPAYNAQPIYGWDLDLINVGYDGAAIQTTDSLSIYATSDPNRSWPAAPIQPPFVLPAGAATEATLLAVKADLETNGLSAAQWLRDQDINLVAGFALNHADLASLLARTLDPTTLWTVYLDSGTGAASTVTKTAPGAGKQLVCTEFVATLVDVAAGAGPFGVRSNCVESPAGTTLQSTAQTVGTGAGFSAAAISRQTGPIIGAVNGAMRFGVTGGGALAAGLTLDIQASGYVFG